VHHTSDVELSGKSDEAVSPGQFRIKLSLFPGG
jgi:hypothetical protein